MKKIMQKTLSVVLSVLFVIYLVPAWVYADMFDAESEVTDVSENISIINEPFEVESLREESVKHFRLEDGTFIAVQYDDAVHRLDESGKWQDIDNTLVSDGQFFSNARVKFAKKTNGSEKLVTIHDGNYKLTLSLDGANKKVNGVINDYETTLENNQNDLYKMTTLDNLAASIVYKDILSNVDLEYIVHSNDLKENIIIKSASDEYRYIFTLKLNNLSAVLQEQEVVIYDPTTDEICYIIPAPYMMDAAHKRSRAVSYELVQSGNNEYKLSIVADEEWMNSEDRVFPVTIDPSVSVPTSSVLDLDIWESDPYYQSYDWIDMFVGPTSRGYWKTSQLPSIPSSAYITKAEISLVCNAIPEDLYTGVYQVTSDWDNTLTWDTAMNSTAMPGQISTEVLDSNYVDTAERYTWNITSLVKQWYSGDVPNYGVCWTTLNGTNEVTTFSTSEASSTSARPKFIVYYEDMKGVESYWSYSTHNVGYAGTGYVNNATGQLTFSIPTLSTTDFLMPYTPTLVYNASLRNTYLTATTADIAYKNCMAGYGFKLNMCESLVQRQYYNDYGVLMTYYVWSDADGTEHAFMPTDTADMYRDEDGLLLTLSYDGSDLYTITDADQNTRIFTRTADTIYYSNGAILKYIVDKNGNAIEFTYTAGRITKIGMRPNGGSLIDYISLSYNSYGLVNRISNAATGESVILYYSSYTSSSTASVISPNNEGYLRKIVRAHHIGNNADADWTTFMNNGSQSNIVIDVTSTYKYNGNGDLLIVRDELHGYEMQYSYHSDKKIATICEYTSEGGQKLGYSYGNLYTAIRNSGADDVYGTDDDFLNHYHFDGKGRAVSVYSTNLDRTMVYGASGATYSEEKNSENKLKTQTTIGGATPNYLLNGGFEISTVDLPLYFWDTTSNISYDFHDNNHVALFEIASNTTETLSQSVFLPAGKYVLSFDYETYDCENVDIIVEIQSLSQSLIYRDTLSVNEHYTSTKKSNVSFYFTADNLINGGEKFKIIVKAVGGSNLDKFASLEVDNFMLEQNLAPTEFSLIQMGGFDSTGINSSGTLLYEPNDVWNSDINTNVVIANASSPFNEVLHISGDYDATHMVYQSIYMAPDSTVEEYAADKIYDPMTFKIAAFGKGTKQFYSNDSTFRLKVMIQYYRGSTLGYEVKEKCFDFNPAITDWQFITGTVTTSAEPGYLVQEIVVALEYNHQPGEAYFDNISVYPCDDETITENEYYSNGRLHWTKNGDYMEFYRYDSTTGQMIVSLNNRGDYYEYDYTLNDVSTANVQTMSVYEYKGTYAYNAENIETEIVGIQEKTLKSKTTYQYNAYGQITQQTDSFVEIDLVTLHPQYLSSSYVYETTAGSKIFGALLSETDSLGRTTRYFYDNVKGHLLTSISPDNQGITYSYDALGNLTSAMPAVYNTSTGTTSATTNAESVSYLYNTKNQLSSISSESTTYTFTYDVFGKTDTIKVGDRTLADYEYFANNGKMLSMEYGNGCTVFYLYDKLENLVEVCYSYDGGMTASSAFHYTYGNSGQLCRFDNYLNGKTTIYTYDTSGRLISVVEYDRETMTNTLGMTQVYDDQSRLMGMTYKVPYVSASDVADSLVSRSDFYKEDGTLSRSTLKTGSNYTTVLATQYTYDPLNRLTLQSNTHGTNAFSSSYAYEYLSAGMLTSGLISSYTSTFNNSETEYSYLYDAVGNITQISVNGVVKYRYAYDTLGQLVREDNVDMGTTCVYVYDDAGNITQKKIYGYTTATTPTGTPTIYNYSYNDGSWGDLLTAYRGVTNTYDAIGNPLNYYNGKSYAFTWDLGRKLTGASVNGNTLAFTYDDNGIRTSKTVNGVEHVYNVSGSTILSEAWGNHLIMYMYDDNGQPVGMQYRNTAYAANTFDTYWFEKNLQGDIVAVYNASGTKLISYTYDAWGNFTTTYSNGGASTSAIYNPFRYRGYYYDTELGLYYLNSRYYDSNTGRFINADVHINANRDILGFNMFAYCGNNPVMGYDPTGEINWSLIGKIALTTVVVAACLTGVGVVAAAAATVMATSVTTAVTTAVITAGISTTLSAIDGAICAELSGGEWYDGAMAGAMGGAAGAFISTLTNPAPNSDSALRMNTLGRATSSFVYDISYEFFDTGHIEPSNLVTYSVDVGMDIVYAPLYYYYTGGGYNGAIRNGILDGVVDIFQTVTVFNN